MNTKFWGIFSVRSQEIWLLMYFENSFLLQILYTRFLRTLIAAMLSKHLSHQLQCKTRKFDIENKYSYVGNAILWNDSNIIFRAFETKWFFHLFLHFTGIIELHVKYMLFICNKGKILLSAMQSPMILSCMVYSKNIMNFSLNRSTVELWSCNEFKLFFM